MKRPSEYHKTYYYKNRKRRLKQLTKARTKARLRNRNFLIDYLSKHPCVDCGESDPIVLDFDHIKGYKLRAVSHMSNLTYSISKITKEIAKCEVRCSNCHRRITAKRGKYFKTTF